MSAKRKTNARPALAVLFLLGALAAWFLVVTPFQEDLTRVKNETVSAVREADMMTAGLKDLSAVEERISSYETNVTAYAGSRIEPLLGSVAMRAKTLLDPMLTECGIEFAHYEDCSSSPLPALVTVSSAPFVRSRVRVTAEASYMKLVSFLCQAERKLPGMCVAAVRIDAGGSDVEVQRGEFVFEWLTEPAAVRKEGGAQ